MMDEQNNVIAAMEVYGAEGMFGEQYSQQVNMSSQSVDIYDSCDPDTRSN